MANDILHKWRPPLDWTKFSQGSISDDVWKIFCEFVELCHAVAHFKAEADDDRKSMRIIGLSRREREDYRRSADREEGNSFRARFLAAERAFSMLAASKNEFDEELTKEILIRTGLANLDTVRGHETANFDVFAIIGT